MKYTYYHKINGVTVAEIEGHAEVERDGSFTVYMHDILTDQECLADDYFRPLIERFLQTEYAGELGEAEQAAVIGFWMHDRETSKAAE